MKRAFTLAEVLITLGIIGIVAAMTLPNLVAKHRLKVLHTQFLKTYSDLNNAALMFKAQEGLSVTQYSRSVTTAGYNSTPVLKKYISYFKSNKMGNTIMGGDTDETTETNATYEKVFGFTPKNLKGNYVKTPSPCDESFSAQEIGGRLFVMDNNLSLIYKDFTYGPKLCVDINGKQGPNIYGYDWFVFVFTEAGPLKPYIGKSLTGLEPDLPNPESFCNKEISNATYTCAYFALQDKNPMGEGTYWQDFLN